MRSRRCAMHARFAEVAPPRGRSRRRARFRAALRAKIAGGPTGSDRRDQESRARAAASCALTSILRRSRRATNEAGAACLSVLTGPHVLQGDPAHLAAARAACALPVLRKDFIVDEYQDRGGARLGADAILLIVAALARRAARRASRRSRASSAWRCWSRSTTRAELSALALAAPLSSASTTAICARSTCRSRPRSISCLPSHRDGSW